MWIIILFIVVDWLNLSLAASINENCDVTFDVALMSERGIDPKVGNFFRHKSQFFPGETTVILSVNGKTYGRVKVRFDEEGQLCFDENFRTFFASVYPNKFSKKNSSSDLKHTWSKTKILLNPSMGSIDLILPFQEISEKTINENYWKHGGSAGILNYDMQYMHSLGRAAEQQFTHFSSEVGFNIHGWIFRSRQALIQLNKQSKISHQAAYVQRSITNAKTILQVGQIHLSNLLFGSEQILGLQIFPESTLKTYRSGAGFVEGIVDSFSILEVRQLGVLIYRGVVPGGQFKLKGLFLLNRHTDLIITIIDNIGKHRQFTVPASQFLSSGNNEVISNYYFGIGLPKIQNDTFSLLGSMAVSWTFSPHFILNAGMLSASSYRAGAFSIHVRPFNKNSLKFHGKLAQNFNLRHKGMMLSTVLNNNLAKRLTANFSATYKTAGYYELYDFYKKDVQSICKRSRNQFNAGLHFLNKLGNLFFSWTYTPAFSIENVENCWRGGWTHQMYQTFINISLEHIKQKASMSYNRLYISLNIPLGYGRNLDGYLSSSQRNSKVNFCYKNRMNQNRVLSVFAEQNFSHNLNTVAGSIDYITCISQINTTACFKKYSKYHHRVYSSLWASGGVVVHSNGITLSPYRISDTFGIAHVDDQAGVKINTPSGSVRTDWRGYAVLPSLNSYSHSNVQVNTRSLNRNIDVGNAFQEVKVARGAVEKINFDVIHNRQVLMNIVDIYGQPLPYGAGIFDVQGQFITVIDQQGRAFIPNAVPNMLLEVQHVGKTLCQCRLTLPTSVISVDLYQRINAVCQ
ncbi:fimbria/pilus outer membrane usher protein [Candidatus Curculioniphilus buchneri]|uniref:fimbria/pilus outer membrane usher protein n=1 Tax=Candidatus Curculioniphilus buchneri TaxID=690594 RepID=UPI00376EE858